MTTSRESGGGVAARSGRAAGDDGPAAAAGNAGKATEDDAALDFELIELLFFAYRDFTSDPDQILARYGFGRAHHRVLHFVNRRSGLTVAELLDVLKITKQSLGRVLKQLIDGGYIVQVQGPRDRRQRELHPTAKGRDLALALAAPQSRRIAEALAEADPVDRGAIARFLFGMVDPELRRQVETAVHPAAGTDDRRRKAG